MSRFEEFKERFNTEGQQLLEKLQDTSIFNQISEQYYNWPSSTQKVFRIASVSLAVLIVFSVPFGMVSATSETVTAFTTTRETIRELLQVSREAASAPQLPTPPPAETLKQQIEASLKSNQILAEQIKGINIVPVTAEGVPSQWIDSGLQILLNKLTINQIIEVGTSFQNIHPNIKITQMSISANKEDALYQDVVFRIFTLAGKSMNMDSGDSETEKKPKFNRKSKKSQDDE